MDGNRVFQDLASCSAHDQSHQRRKFAYQNLSPNRAAAKPQPRIKPRAPRARAPENCKEFGITEKNKSRITNTPENAPQTKRTQNSSLSVLGIPSAVTLIRSLVEGLGGWLLCPLSGWDTLQRDIEAEHARLLNTLHL